jgi:hypothetical protein
MGHNLIVMEGQPMKPKKSQQSQQSKQSQQQSRGGKMQRGERPVLTGRIQSREEVDGKVEYRDVGRLGLWKVKQVQALGPQLYGRISISGRDGHVRAYVSRASSVTIPVLRGEVLDTTRNVVGQLVLWVNTKKKSEKSPSFTGRVTFSSTSTEYGVSVWGDIPYVSDGGDAPF